MGVKGWTKWLKEQGWLPDERRGHTGATALATIIPPRSTLHIDGNGIVFHWHRIAYERYLASTSPLSMREKLPMYLPLHLLLEVMDEWVRPLLSSYSLVFYFDGEYRRTVKQDTDGKRQLQLEDEWDRLHGYCTQGMIDHRGGSNREPSFFDTFPHSRLVATQIMHHLRTCQDYSRIEIIECKEEADPVLAQNTTNRDTHFVIGNDSDFCFFANVQYIPLTTIDFVSHGMIQGQILRRSELADTLGVDDELMTEVAILMGNDFVDRHVSYFQDNPPLKLNSIVKFLNTKGSDYRVKMKNPDDDDSHLEFVRALYNFLPSREDFPLYQLGGDVTIEEEDDSIDGSIRPSLPQDLDILLSKVKLTDSSVKDAVIRCLENFMDVQCPEEQHMLKKYIDAWKQMPVLTASSSRTWPRQEATEEWKPSWEDVKATYLIEKLIAYSYKESPKWPGLSLFSPSDIFDARTFHAILQQDRLVHIKQPSTVEEPTSEGLNEKIPIEAPKLPIDEHEDRILDSIRKNRVSIIQGETGCGKSTRIPIMILNSPPPDPTFAQVKLYMSQPRRIAAKGLVERVRSVEPTLGRKIALRMGHGVVEYETKETVAWFVTTGYLVRVLANHPERFSDVSHLIIDEVHERSVDTDILCLLCRRLLKINHRIRLILMSATLAAALYQDYFDVPQPPIKVGARRFPVKEVYLEDLAQVVNLSKSDSGKVSSLVAKCDQLRAKQAPPASYMEAVFSIVAKVAMTVGEAGTSVLIFVPGMNEIEQITESIEALFVHGIEFNCFPIHSDIPFEDQLGVFQKTKPNEVKVVIATNAAESSVTLPDVDNVICLGLCKQIVYNEASHRQMLLPTWISQASATQRAGRTGRVRPGTVYRMYTRKTFSDFMVPFEPGEMVRIPLDSVILMLKEMLTDEKVSEVLLDCLEPPDISTIDRSFASLFKSRFITTPDDSCEITNLGKFVQALGIDLMLGALIGLGIQHGVGSEAIQLAAILSFPQTPWAMTNPLIHDVEYFNDVSIKAFQSKLNFDGGLFSEPLATMNLLWEYEKADKKRQWCGYNTVSHVRMTRLSSTARNLTCRVADFCNIKAEDLIVKAPPASMHPSQLLFLQIIQTWVFNENIIECRPSTFLRGVTQSSVRIELGAQEGKVSAENLHQILDPDKYQYNLGGYLEIDHAGHFSFVENGNRGDDTSLGRQFVMNFQERLLSYIIEKGIQIAWFICPGTGSESHMTVLVQESIASGDNFSVLLEKLNDRMGRSLVQMEERKGNLRGRHERPAGRWKMSSKAGQSNWIRFEKSLSKNKMSSLIFQLTDFVRSTPGHGLLSVNFQIQRDKRVSFLMALRGEVSKVLDVDMGDLLATDSYTFKTKEGFNRQTIEFLRDQTNQNTGVVVSCIPPGCQILAMLASSRRREHVIYLVDVESKNNSNLGSKKEKVGEATPTYISMRPDPKQTKVLGRWKRRHSNATVYVNENSVPATALDVESLNSPMYCCCANTLEVKGGGVRADGLSILPFGASFLLLCELSFGLYRSIIEEFGDEFYRIQLKILQDEIKDKNAKLDSKTFYQEWLPRIKSAITFDEESEVRGEELICRPASVKRLLSIFDGVGGHVYQCWDLQQTDPFTPGYVSSNQLAQGKNRTSPIRSITTKSPEKSHRTPKRQNGKLMFPSPKGRNDNSLSPVILTNATMSANSMFEFESPNKTDLISSVNSTNVLGILFKKLCSAESIALPDVSLDGGCWSVFALPESRQHRFIAHFTSPIKIDPTAIRSLSSRKKFPRWINDDGRPEKKDALRACIPPSVWEQIQPSSLVLDGSIYYRTVELAIAVEACIWLEKQVSTLKKHWYERTIPAMVNSLRMSSKSAR